MTHALSTTSPVHTLPLVPWRDPYTVSSADLVAHVRRLEQACLDNPQSADLRTCLGVAYAVNYDVYKSMDAFEAAVALDPGHFWAQIKLAELQYRLRALDRAEAETLRALNLAGNPWQFSTARKQLQEIRRLKHESIRNVTWSKPLAVPAGVFSLMMLVLFLTMMWK
jgi:tetratricopeptide (TPR) repeat protein